MYPDCPPACSRMFSGACDCSGFVNAVAEFGRDRVHELFVKMMKKEGVTLRRFDTKAAKPGLHYRFKKVM